MELPDWLAGLSLDALEDLLSVRPDVLAGRPPNDLAGLANRLSQPESIASALLSLPRPAVQVLGALQALGGAATAARCSGLLRTTLTVDGADHLTQVEGWLGRLAAYGLVWEDGDRVRCPPRVRQALDAPDVVGMPAALLLPHLGKDRLGPVLRAWGLDVPSTKGATIEALLEVFSDPARVAAQLQTLSEQHRAVLRDDVESVEPDHLAWSPRRYSLRLEAMEAGVRAGLLLPGYSIHDASMPAEVELVLRGMQLPFDPQEPPLTRTEVAPQMMEREAQAALTQFNEACLTLVDRIRTQPVQQLKSGGVGAREVTKLAKACKLPVPTVRLVLELACAACLFEDNGRTLAYGQVTDAWRDSDAGARAVLLIEQWPMTPGHPTVERDETGALPVAAPGPGCFLCTEGRMTLVAELLRLEPGVTASEASLGELVGWARPFAHLTHQRRPRPDDEDGYAGGRHYGARRPRRWEDTSDLPLVPVPAEGPHSCEVVLAEAAALGLVAHGAVTPLMQALAAADRGTGVAWVEELLPSASAQAKFDSDLTAVVTGPPTGELSALLDSCADRESRGGAVTWRFSTASVRRAMDRGTSAEELVERLSAVAAGSLPQPLTYLVGDVGRRHGSLRVGGARSVVTGLDPALLAEAVVDRKLVKLGLRLLAPTVASATVGEGEVLAALRDTGYLPMPLVEEEKRGSKATAEGEDRSPDDVGAQNEAVVLDFPAARLTGGAGERSRLDLALEQVESVLGPPWPEPEAEPPADAATRLVGRTHADVSVEDPELVDALSRAGRTLGMDEILTLAQAILQGRAVLIRYRASGGSTTTRRISGLAFDGYAIDAWCHLRNDDRRFLVSEILSVRSR